MQTFQSKSLSRPVCSLLDHSQNIAVGKLVRVPQRNVVRAARMGTADRKETLIPHMPTMARNIACPATRRPAVFMYGYDDYADEPEEMTVIKLQVGLFGDISRWQRKFNEMASKYDTEDEEQLHTLYEEVLLLFRRNTEYCAYVTSAGRMYESIDAAQAKYTEVSFEERAKCKEETLSNVDGRVKQDLDMSKPDAWKDADQWMCVTMLVAAERFMKLPQISSVMDFQQALKKLSGVSVEELVAFELMWTPQREGDSYSKNELLADYPSMVNLL